MGGAKRLGTIVYVCVVCMGCVCLYAHVVCVTPCVWWCALLSPASSVCAVDAKLPVHCTGGAVAAVGARGESGGQSGCRD